MTTPILGSRPFSDSSPDQGDSLARGYSRSAHDPACIVVWKFDVDAARVAEFTAVCEASRALLDEQPKCLFQRVTSSMGGFRVHVGLEDSYGVLTHVALFAETLEKLSALACYRGLEIHGEGSDLAELRHPLERLRPLYVEHVDATVV